MDNLFKQLRVSFSRLGEEDQDNSNSKGEERIRPRKTVSFKEERKKTKNWFQRQLSDQMSELDSSDDEYVTAVAAATLVVTLLEGEGSLNAKISDVELKRTLTKTKSKREESMEKQTDQGRISRWFSTKEAKDDERTSGETSMRKSSTLEKRLLGDSNVDQKVPIKAMGTTPSMRKTPSFSDKYLNDTGRKRIEQGQPPRTGQNNLSKPGKWDENRIDSNEAETKVDAWKKAKLAKIQRRYEKLMTTILEWENERKVKAKRRMERKEREMEQRRARVLQEHRNEISRIDKIAGGARAVADEKKRNDESIIIEKAKVLSSTGKDPKECSCC